MHVWKKFGFEIQIVSCIFMQLTIFLQIALCARFWLIYTNPILIKNWYTFTLCDNARLKLSIFKIYYW